MLGAGDVLGDEDGVPLVLGRGDTLTLAEGPVLGFDVGEVFPVGFVVGDMFEEGEVLVDEDGLVLVLGEGDTLTLAEGPVLRDDVGEVLPVGFDVGDVLDEGDKDGLVLTETDTLGEVL